MSPPKSDMWKYFDKVDKTNVICRVCGKHLKTSGNTTNVKKHLETKHPSILSVKDVEQPQSQSRKRVREISLVDDEDDPPVSVGCGSPKAGTSSSSTPTTFEVIKDVQVANIQQSHQQKSPMSLFTVPMQPTVASSFFKTTSYAVGGSRHCEITESLLFFITRDCQPFSIVEGVGFKKFIKTVTPLYKVPSRNSIKSSISKKYDLLSQTFGQCLQNVEYVSLTSDIWTETMATKSFLGITVHFIENDELSTATLGVIQLSESHTAEYIASQLEESLGKWQIPVDKVLAMVTDNAANMVKAVSTFLGKHKHIPCLAHTVNLVVENAMKKTDGLNDLLDKVREIVKHIKNSVNASDQLRKMQVDTGVAEGAVKKLILDVKTRWNSGFYMCQRFVELSSLVSSILLQRPMSPPMLTAAEIETLKEIVNILRVLEKVTTEISGESYTTGSLVIPIVNCLRQNINNIKFQPAMTIGRRLKEALSAEITKRLGAVEDVHLLAVATVLDPRFKTIHFNDPVASSKVIKFLRTEICSEAKKIESESSDSDKESNATSGELDLWSYHKKLAHKNQGKAYSKSSRPDLPRSTVELDMYLSAPVCALNSKPLHMWSDMKSSYPHLHKIAKKYLSVVGTSVPSERLFSKAGATISQSRNRLSEKMLSKLLFLNSISERFWFT